MDGRMDAYGRTLLQSYRHFTKGGSLRHLSEKPKVVLEITVNASRLKLHLKWRETVFRPPGMVKQFTTVQDAPELPQTVYPSSGSRISEQSPTAPALH